MGDTQDALFKRVVRSSFDPLEHVTKLGIRLRSTSISGHTNRPCTPRSLRMISAKSRLSTRAKSSTSRFTPHANNVTQIYNMVVPINARDDEHNVKVSNSPQSFSSERSRNQSGTLPHMIKSLHASPRSAKSNGSNRTDATTNVTFHIDKALPSHSSANADKMYSSNQVAKWRNKEQPRRFQHEQEIRNMSRHLSRCSQVRPHRVDRMYYMSGTGLNLNKRYEVDENEFQRLQDLANERKSHAHYGRGLSRYKYFELPTETHLPDTFTPGPLWQIIESNDPDLSSSIVIPTDEDHRILGGLVPHGTLEKKNRNNSARSSINPDGEEELMRNLVLDDDSNSRLSYDSYIPYLLSRAENYYDDDDSVDGISAVAAENSESEFSKEKDVDETGSGDCSENGKNDKLTHLLHQKLCLKASNRGMINRGDKTMGNTNNNASGKEEDGDLLHYGCDIQTSRSGRLPVPQCSHRTKQIPCPRCGHKEPNLSVRDVKFAYRVLPTHGLVIEPPETKTSGKDGVFYRCRGLMGSKRTVGPNPSPASTPDSTWRYNKINSDDIIGIIHNSNVTNTPTLPEILRGKMPFHVKTPNNDTKDIYQETTSKRSTHVVSLPKVDLSPNSSMVSTSIDNDTMSGTNSDKSVISTPEERYVTIVTVKTKGQKSKSVEQTADQTRKRTRSYQTTFVQSNHKIPSVKMQVLPPHYRNSFHGSFIPHSLLKARVPTMTSKQRMDVLRGSKCNVPSNQRVVVEVKLSNNSSGKVHVYRKNITALQKYAKIGGMNGEQK